MTPDDLKAVELASGLLGATGAAHEIDEKRLREIERRILAIEERLAKEGLGDQGGTK